MIEWREYTSYCHSIRPLLSACVFRSLPTSSWNWLTGFLTDRTNVVEPCSPGTRPGHIWPQYTSLYVATLHHSQFSGLQPKKAWECDGNICMHMEYILSQSNVSDSLTCRHNAVWTHQHHTYTTGSQSAHSTASIYAQSKQLLSVPDLKKKKNSKAVCAQFVMLQK